MYKIAQWTLTVIFLGSNLTAQENSPAAHPFGKETEGLTNLIASSKETISRAEELKKEVDIYLQLQETYINDPSNRDSCYRMVKTAHQILDTIENNNLQQAFNPDFLKELTLFAEIGKKRGLPQL